MAQNLNFNTSASVCYDNDNANCAKYGRLYDWATVMGLPSTCNSSICANQVRTPHQGICPAGWRVPSDDDWTVLTNFVGANPGAKLRSTSGWHNNGNGTDDFGFSALPGGSRWSIGFLGVRTWGFWWSATEHDAEYDAAAHAWYWAMNRDNSSVDWSNNFKTRQLSARCVRD
jgi:uncharacterized protein (TIGR02145 family)